MTKGQKLVSLNDDILNDIKNNSKHYGFNFSDWVSTAYKKEFMDIDHKLERIDDLTNEIETIKKEIEDTKIRTETLSEALSRQETRYLESVPRLLFEGKEVGAMCRMFNITFHKHMDVAEFIKSYKFFENENNKQKNKR